MENEKKEFHKRLLQYEEYNIEVTQRLQKMKKYEDAIQKTIYWLLETFSFCSRKDRSLQMKMKEVNNSFVKVFQNLNQHLEELGIEEKLKVLIERQHKMQ